VIRLPGRLPQLLLPDRQRAQSAQPGLQHHNDDRGQVAQAKPGVSDPRPAPPPADQDRQLTNDHEPHDQRVDDQDQIGPQAWIRNGLVDIVAHRLMLPRNHACDGHADSGFSVFHLCRRPELDPGPSVFGFC